MKTTLLILLDESGSMAQNKIETIKTFNNLLSEQQQITNDEGKIFFLTFNTEVKWMYSDINLTDAPNLTEKDYNPNGMTALYDAIFEGVNQVNDYRKTTTDTTSWTELNRVICLIITDGLENASKKYKLTDLKKLIKNHEKEGNWTFIYVGADPNGWIENSGTESQNSIGYDVCDSCQITSNGIFRFRKTNLSQTNNVFSKSF
jgi:uncharacterized protein YegL